MTMLPLRMQTIAKVEWCENFIRATFKKLPAGITGIERNLFFRKAEAAGLYEHDTYGSPMSQALMNLCRIETAHDKEGNFLYDAFKLA